MDSTLRWSTGVPAALVGEGVRGWLARATTGAFLLSTGGLLSMRSPRASLFATLGLGFFMISTGSVFIRDYTAGLTFVDTQKLVAMQSFRLPR